MRFALFLYVNRDPIPGAFHTKDSARLNTRGILENYGLGQFRPTVSYAPDELQPEDPIRLALVIYIDLDVSREHPKNAALSAVRDVLREAIPHYNPVVTYGRRDFQPSIIEGTVVSGGAS